MKTGRLITTALLAGLLVTTVSCYSPFSDAVSRLEFSLASDIRESRQTIYSNDTVDALVLNARLEIRSGCVVIEIANCSTGETVWKNTYNTNADFTIELGRMQAGSEYSISVSAVDAQSVRLFIGSDVKLVKNRQKPSK